MKLTSRHLAYKLFDRVTASISPLARRVHLYTGLLTKMAVWLLGIPTSELHGAFVTPCITCQSKK